MKKILLFFALFAFTPSVFAQNILNLEMISNYTFDENCSDIWGYVAPDGTEYAVIGTNTTTSIHDLTDPTDPVQVASISGASSTWRDMKQWGEFVYVTTDVGQDGLLVVDMREAPTNITWEFWKPEILGSTLETCHNIYIDENGYAYLAGCNMNSGGVIIVDVATTPGSPEFVGAAEPVYSHDAFVRGDTLWSSDITSGYFSVQDVSDKTNVTLMATQTTTMNFTHNEWLSDDGKYLFTTDERGNAYVDAYDVSDLTDIKRLDSYQPADTKGLGVIPHNAHYFEGYLVVSWYTDGVKVIDVHRPDNMIEVASYDTYDGPDGGFSGCWGVTPFLPSGLVLVSDINSGLYVFDPTYVRACYLEGTVTDATTGAALNEVEVIIESATINNELTNPSGIYKTGQATAGTFDVTFSKPGYEPETMSVTLVNGEVTVLDVQLTSLPTVMVTGETLRNADDTPIIGAKVFLSGEDFSYEVTSDADGNFTIPGVYFGNYDMYAGAWGYQNIALGMVTINEAGNYTVKLDEGYQDDFIVDLGWVENGDASTGRWTRAEPVGTGFQGFILNPEEDVADDVGNYCYTTGNEGGGAGQDDIDDGNTVITSPPMDLTTYTNPALNFHFWFVNGGGSGTPNDFLSISMSNGIETVEMRRVTSLESASEWVEISNLEITDFLEITNDMRVIVEAADLSPGHLVEAGIDAFFINDAPVAIDYIATEDLTMEATPNPFQEAITISYDLANFDHTAQLAIYNVLGQQVEQHYLTTAKANIEVGQDLQKGIYFVQISVSGHVSKAMKIVKE